MIAEVLLIYLDAIIVRTNGIPSLKQKADGP